eukprot:g27432.t1
MNAANFTTFSTGIGSHGFVLSQKYLHDYPSEFYRMQGMGLMKQLPKNTADKELDKPAYVFDVKYSMSASIIAETMNPRLGQLTRSTVEWIREILVMRLDNGGETVRWMTALQDATQKDQSFRDLLNDVPLLSPGSSPRSESTPQSPTMEELEALRARLSQQESSSKEMEEGMKAACTRADAAAQAFHDSQDRAKCLEKALLEEQAKRKQVSCGKAREPDVKQIDQLQRRLACAEQRLSGAELVRKAAEERREGAEQRLAETEELLEQAVKKLAVSGQSSDDEATRRLRGVEAELKALKLIKAQADADGSELKKDLEEAKAKITTLQQTANQSEAAKVALEAQVETLQTRVADQEARLMDQDELQRALAEQQEAKDTLEKLERLSKQESEERLGF